MYVFFSEIFARRDDRVRRRNLDREIVARFACVLCDIICERNYEKRGVQKGVLIIRGVNDFLFAARQRIPSANL